MSQVKGLPSRQRKGIPEKPSKEWEGAYTEERLAFHVIAGHLFVVDCAHLSTGWSGLEKNRSERCPRNRRQYPHHQDEDSQVSCGSGVGYCGGWGRAECRGKEIHHRWFSDSELSCWRFPAVLPKQPYMQLSIWKPALQCAGRQPWLVQRALPFVPSTPTCWRSGQHDIDGREGASSLRRRAYVPSRPCKHKSERACVEKEELGKLYVGYGEFLYQRDWTQVSENWKIKIYGIFWKCHLEMKKLKLKKEIHQYGKRQRSKKTKTMSLCSLLTTDSLIIG